MKLEENLQSLILNELKIMGVHIPKSKKRINHCRKNQSTCYESSPDQIFGVSLASQEWITIDCHGTPVPRFLAIATEYLLQYKQSEGLFRKTGSITRQRELRKCIENGGNLEGTTPHDVTSVLKQWFRELPEPVIPRSLHDIFLCCYQMEENRTAACLLACLLLPPDHLYTLQHTVNFLSGIAKHSSQNKMNSFNLAVIMAPNLLPISKQSSEKTRLQNCHPDNWKRRSRNSPTVNALDLRSLVEYQTGLIHLLIENNDKIGHFPSDIAEKFSSFGVIIHEEGESERSVDGLEKSDELVEGPPKAKKKRRSGTVQELMSGIRKLVSQKRTPLQSLPVTSDICSPLKFIGQDNVGSRACRSASKRKADSEVSLSVDKKTLHEKMTLGSKFVSTPETNELHLTPILSPCVMISLSDIDCDSPTEINHNPSPMVQTHRKSLRIIKNKQRQRNTSIYARKNVKLHIQETGKPNLISTEINVQENEAVTENSDKFKEHCSPEITVHLTRQVASLSLVSPNQALSDNDIPSHKLAQLGKSNQNNIELEKSKTNNCENLIEKEPEERLDTTEALLNRKNSIQGKRSENCQKDFITEENKMDNILKENYLGSGYEQECTKENLVRKVGSMRNGKSTTKPELEKQILSSMVTDKRIIVSTNGKNKAKPARKYSSRSNTKRKSSDINIKTKGKKKVSSCSITNKENSVGNTKYKTKLSRKTSSCEIKEKSIIDNADCKTKLENSPSSCPALSNKMTTIVNPENIRSRNKSSLRRGRPNTITTGLPPSIYNKYCSDSAVCVDTKSSSQTLGKRITRSKSASNNNLHGKETIIRNDTCLFKVHKTKNKGNITSSTFESLSKLDIAESKNSDCSPPLEADHIKKSLFAKSDSGNDSFLNSIKLNDSMEHKCPAPDKKNCDLNSKVDQLKDAVVEINSINISLTKANISISNVSLQLDQCKDHYFLNESKPTGNSHLECEDKTQLEKVENKQLEDSNLNDNDTLNIDKLDPLILAKELANENRKGFLIDPTITPKETLSFAENSSDLIQLSKTYEEPQWTPASEYLSKQENEICDYTKRESIIKLRIKNAGVVKANVQRYNSIGGNGSFCTPEICRTRKSQSPASVCIPSPFMRNGVGTRSLHGKALSVGEKTNIKSKLTDSTPKPITCSSANSEFKMPTPLRKTRKQIQLTDKENMCLRSRERVSSSPANVY